MYEVYLLRPPPLTYAGLLVPHKPTKSFWGECTVFLAALVSLLRLAIYGCLFRTPIGGILKTAFMLKFSTYRPTANDVHCKPVLHHTYSLPIVQIVLL